MPLAGRRRTCTLLALLSFAAMSCSNDFARFHFVQPDSASDASIPNDASPPPSEAEDSGADDNGREGTSE